MSENRLPRQVHFAKLTHGERTRGGQRKRFKDTAKHYMKKGQIDINAWTIIAAERQLWRRSVCQTIANFETNRLLHEAEKGQTKKEWEMCKPGYT